ncbi:MAG: hypothetical protein KJ922_03165, partial [Nanoarchaeota archaeon]|nr:hypothetical protein [Nanoarchaeota archaeon]
MRKRGQGVNAAVLVAIIAGLIIVYLLFLPPDELEPYLDDGTGTGGTSTTDSGNPIVLLSENIGRLDPADKADDRDVPNVYLFETTEAKEIDKFNPIYIRNGVFDKKDKSITFTLDDLENTDNLLLSFAAPIRKGVLSVELNSNLIYEYVITNVNPSPIEIPKKYLSNNNELTFKVSGVGWMFWKTNEYQLEEVRIIGDITDKSRQEARNVFTMTDNEYQNLESASLRFVPYCGTAAQVGKLTITVNNREVFSAVPVCDDPYNQPVPISVLSGGANRVVFKTEKGSYSIEQITMKLQSKDTVSSVYYFEVNESVYSK